MTRNIHIKLAKMIPNFDCLSSEKKHQFIDKINKETPKLYKALDGEDRIFQDPILNKFSRTSSLDGLKNQVYSYPAFPELRNEIYIYNIQKLGINLNILNETEREALFNTPYTKLPFPDTWLEFFYEDNDMIDIHQKLIEDFQNEFVFLFKTQSFKFHHEINQYIQNPELSTDDKNEL